MLVLILMAADGNRSFYIHVPRTRYNALTIMQGAFVFPLLTDNLMLIALSRSSHNNAKGVLWLVCGALIDFGKKLHR